MIRCAVYPSVKNVREEPALNYVVHPGQGPYLGLLHGFLSSGRQWLLNLEALAEVCTPVTIDMWGHGDSPAPADLDLYRPQAYVDQLERIRQNLKAEQWFLCGYSLGAGITIRYTHQYPERVIAHGLTNSNSAFANEALVSEWQASSDASAKSIRAGGLPAIERIAVHPRHARRLPQPVYDALLQDSKKLSPDAVANTLLRTNVDVSTRDIAPTNPRPALLAFGRHEKRFSKAKDWALANMADLKVIELDAGHAVNMEDAEGFNSAWIAFIREHTS
ncbi:MAG: alpha/beta fold hydrolase [Pseudomonadales bacterium]|nr:alpha/beta fold hydrolase [Pseudomonadales bacterium]